MEYGVRPVVSDYGVYEDSNLKLICNVNSNANLICDIMKSDDRNEKFEIKDNRKLYSILCDRVIDVDSAGHETHEHSLYVAVADTLESAAVTISKEQDIELDYVMQNIEEQEIDLSKPFSFCVGGYVVE